MTMKKKYNNEKEILETLILGHIAKELKDEIQVGRQVNLAKTIMQALCESFCNNCEPISGFYLGTTCPKCNRPFRSVKQTVR